MQKHNDQETASQPMDATMYNEIITIKMTEYKALRQDLDEYIKIGGVILTIVTLLVSAEIGVWLKLLADLYGTDSPTNGAILLVGSLFALVIPYTILFAGLLMSVSIMGVRKIAYYVFKAIEEPIQQLLIKEYSNWLNNAGSLVDGESKFVMGWESWIRKEPTQITLVGGLVAVFGMAIASAVLGVSVIVTQDMQGILLTWAIIAFSAFSFIFGTVFCVKLVKEYRHT